MAGGRGGAAAGAAFGKLIGAVAAGALPAVGTCTMALHCGQAARLPAAEAATFRVRPQLVQLNSIEEGEVCESEDVLIRESR